MYDKNVYSDPEFFDLEILGVVEEDLSYAFDILVVWKHKSGKLFWTTDSGCSCPTPFEDYFFKSENDTDLDPLNKNTLDDFVGAVKRYDVSVSEKSELIEKVRKELEL